MSTHPSHLQDVDMQQTIAPIPAPATAPWWAKTMLPTLSLLVREVLRFFRQKGRVIGSLGTPLMFWFLLGSGFGRSLTPSSLGGATDYMGYFFPGALLLVVVFTAIFSSMSVIQDRQEGFLQGVLVAPVPRLSIVVGKVLGGAILGALQGMLMLALAPLAGLPLGVEGFFAASGIIFLTALGLSALGFIFAWGLDSVQGFHAVMNLVLMPMWLLSGAFFPAAGAAFWLQAVMAANPLSYGLEALRAVLGDASVYDNFVSNLLVLGAFAVVTLLMSAWLVSRPEKG